MKEKIRKLSGTSKKKIFAGSSLSLFCSYSMPHLLGRIRNNHSINNHNISALIVVILASMATLWYLFYHHRNNYQPAETIRRNNILKRKLLTSPKEKYASLKVDQKFMNPFDEWSEVPFYKTVLFWMRRWKGNGIPKCKEELENTLPVMKPDLDTIKRAKNAVTFTWFGQSTCLMTINGLTILSDPVFSKCSINDYLGPKRLRPIPCQLEDFINDIDIVLVSHDHFDHLDENAVHKLGNSVVWYVPLGLKKWFLKRNITNVIELDWWQELMLEIMPDTKIACVPAMHWSGSRTPFEKNNTLWCSYVIQSGDNKIFFWQGQYSGDTGYCPELFQSIGKLYAPFTLAAIPIGSFMPTHLMKHLHMGPEDAIKAHIDLGFPRLSVGIHWATFMMSDEYYMAPKQLLDSIWGDIEIEKLSIVTTENSNENTTVSPNKYLNESKFITTAFGQTISLDELK